MIRVLIVDDSALVRRVLVHALGAATEVEVVGAAADAADARRLAAALRPDVITLDLDLPDADGLDFLGTLMAEQPTPVVVVSAVAPRRGERAMRALALGAVEIIEKPGSAYTAPDGMEQLVRAVCGAAHATVARARPTPCATPVVRSRPTPCRPPAIAAHPTPPASRAIPRTHPWRGGDAASPAPPRPAAVIAIGASTGGTRAIERVLARLPENAPGMVIVQHMPAGFTGAFARRLDGCCRVRVREAREGDRVARGVALVAPGGSHLRLVRAGVSLVVRLGDDAPVHHQRPSVDVLFESVASAAGGEATGVLLTGMGEDGARGLLAMRRRGAYTVAESERSCVVFGMPREAIALGAACVVLPLDAVPAAILGASGERGRG